MWDTYSLSLDTGETSSSTLTGHSLHTRGSLTTGGTSSTRLSLYTQTETEYIHNYQLKIFNQMQAYTGSVFWFVFCFLSLHVGFLGEVKKARG